MNTEFAGLNGFVWWIGVVENRIDPLKLGRCKVRCVGWHSDNKMELPTENLPWAQLLLPVNNANTYAPKEGDMVMGFFLDGENAQEPIIMGVLPGIPLRQSNPQQAFSDARQGSQLSRVPIKPGESATNYPRVLDEPTTSRLARNENIEKTQIQKIKDNKLKNELSPSYRTLYPYNNVTESESGHLFEMDDTPSAERLHLFHRSGSYQEFRPDGTVQFKTKENSYESIGKNKNVYVKGDMTVVIDGNLSFVVGKNVSIQAGQNFSAAATIMASMSGKVSASVSSLVNASISGLALTSAGAGTSMTSVKGLTTDVSAKTVASFTGDSAAIVSSPGTLYCNGTGATFLQSGGIVEVGGSVVRITGAPVGGLTGAAAAAVEAAEEASKQAVEQAQSASQDVQGAAVSAASQDVPINPDAIATQTGDVAQNITGVADSGQTEMSKAISDIPEPGVSIDGYTGESTTVFQNPDGSFSHEIISADGEVLSSGPVTGPIQTTVEITAPDGGFEGFATQVTNPDGSFYVLDNAGEIIEQGQLPVTDTISIQEQFGAIYDNAQTVIEESYKELRNLPVSDTLEKTAKENFDALTQPVRDNLSNIEEFSKTLATDTATYSEKWRAAQGLVAETTSLITNTTALAAVGPETFVTSTITGTASSLSNTYQNNVIKNEAIQNAKTGMSVAFDKTIEGAKQQASSQSSEMADYLVKSYDEISFQDKNRIVNESARITIEAREAGLSPEVAAEKALKYQSDEITRRSKELHGDFPTTSKNLDTVFV